MPSPDTGQAAGVRKHLSQLDGPFAAYQVAHALGISVKEFHWTIQRMQERGEIQKACRGWYYYIGVRLNPRPAPKRERLMRAMHVKGHFSSRDIAVLADTTTDTAQRNVRLFLRLGQIERTGSRHTLRGHLEGIYRVKDKEKFLKQKEV